MHTKTLLITAGAFAGLKSTSHRQDDQPAATHANRPHLLTRTALVLLLLGTLLGAPSSWAVTYYYFSGGGANGNWSTAANWSVNGVPPGNSTNVAIVFLSGANNKTSVVDIAGMTVRSIEFLQISNHVITSPVARTLTVIGQGRATPALHMTLPSNVSYGRFLLDSNLELVVSNECLFLKDYATYVNSMAGILPNDSLVIAGRISGPGSLCFGERTTFNNLEVTLQGSLGNTYSGLTSVTNGVALFLDKSAGSAIPGPLTVDTFCDAIWLRDNQVANAAVITNSGSLDLNGHSDTLGELHLEAGSTTYTGAGLLTLGGDVFVEGGTASIYGHWALGTPAVPRIGRQFFAEGAEALEVHATIGGSAILRKVGDGKLSLLYSNSFTGMAVLEAGKTVIGHSNALGSVVGSTYVGLGAKLSFDGDSFFNNASTLTCAEPLDIADHEGPGGWPIAVEAVNAIQVTLTGPIHLSGSARFYEDIYDGLVILGPVEGPGSFHASAGLGGIHFEGSATNVHTGGTFADYGDLFLNRTGTGRCVPGGLIVSGTVSAPLPDQLTVKNWLVLSNTAAVSLSGNQAVASLEGQGIVWIGGLLTLGATGSNSVFSGSLRDSGSAGSLSKTGSGTLTLLGTNFLSGQTTIAGGQLLVNGSNPNSPITLVPSATLAGTGRVASVTGTGGLILPGPGKGALKSGWVSLASNQGLLLEIGGTNSGVDADVLRVTGTVTLSNSPLYITWQTGGKAGNKYLVIDNDGADPVAGNFSALPHGTVWTYNGIQYQISYTGGTGNDVVITQLTNPPKPTLSRVQRLPGGQTQVEGTGLPGVPYQVEGTVSLNPPAWINLGAVTASTPAGLIQFVDPDAVFLPVRFYRYVLP